MILKILIVSDKFKGSLSSREAGEAIASGLGKSRRNIVTEVIPMADGGEGSLEVIAEGITGIRDFVGESLSRVNSNLKEMEYESAVEGQTTRVIWVKASDPLRREVEVPFLMRGSIAYIEMAKVCGLQLLSRTEYDPWKASTYGLGEIILAAISRGADEIVTGIGGSATNDGGMGMLAALGYKFLDKYSAEALHIGDVVRIDGSGAVPELKNIKFTVAVDVNNPLLGIRGAARVYSPQKGAGKAMVEKLETAMMNYANVCETFLGKSFRDNPGAGAAGGTGFAFMAFLGASMLPGWKVLFQATGIERRSRDYDLIVTGEGSVDEQSLSGKLLSGICSLAEEGKKRVWVYCGENKLSPEQLKNAGVRKIFRIMDIARDKKDAVINAKSYLEKISCMSATFFTEF
jgi:glycerate kinase